MFIFALLKIKESFYCYSIVAIININFAYSSIENIEIYIYILIIQYNQLIQFYNILNNIIIDLYIASYII